MTFLASPSTPYQIHQQLHGHEKVIGFIDSFATHLSYGLISEDYLKRQFVYTFGNQKAPSNLDTFSIRYWRLQGFYKKELEILNR